MKASESSSQVTSVSVNKRGKLSGNGSKKISVSTIKNAHSKLENIIKS